METSQNVLEVCPCIVRIKRIDVDGISVHVDFREVRRMRFYCYPGDVARTWGRMAGSGFAQYDENDYLCIAKGTLLISGRKTIIQ